MKTKKIVSLFSVVLALMFFCVAVAEEKPAVTPEEIIIKVREAAKLLEEKGEAGLADFNKPESPWVWSGTYIFVFNCEKGIIAAHPNNKLIGIELASRTDPKGNRYNLDLCEASKKSEGGWVEYWRPTDTLDEKGEAKYRRKISYIISVLGIPYEIGAGIYEPTLTVEELNKMIDEVK